MNDSSIPDFQYLKQLIKGQLKELLDSVSSPKDLILDPKLMKPLDRVVGALFLREHGVDKIYKLGQNQQSHTSQRVYMLKAHPDTVKQVANDINSDKIEGRNHKYLLIFIPRLLNVCSVILEQEGVYGYVRIEQMSLGFIPLDRDVISLEMPEFFEDFFLESDQTGIHTIGRSLWELQSLFGVIPNVYGQGRAAKLVYDMMNTIGNLYKISPSPNYEIGHLFLFDRDIDYVSTLLSPMTYEGLLDLTFGIKSGYVELEEDVTGTNKPIKLLLTSYDLIFNEIRDYQFSQVSNFLGTKARELSDLKKQAQSMSIAKMKDLVQELKSKPEQAKYLGLHISICEGIMIRNKNVGEQLNIEHTLLDGSNARQNIAYLEESINRQGSMMQVLRTLCLLSVTQDGVGLKDYKSLIRQFLQSYGYNHQAPTSLSYTSASAFAGKMMNSAASVASSARKPKSFRSLARKFQQIPEGEDEFDIKKQAGLGYVFNGAYIPLACNLVRHILTSKSGMVGFEENLKLLPGSTISTNRATSARGSKQAVAGDLGDPHASKVVLVYFLGGVTYAEISAFRQLSKHIGYRFIIATTCIINGNKLIEGLV